MGCVYLYRKMGVILSPRHLLLNINQLRGDGFGDGDRLYSLGG